EGDTENSPRVTVIDDNMAHQYFPGEDPVGKYITIQTGKDTSVDLQIVGVAAHVKQENLYTDTGAGVAATQFYTAFGQLPDRLIGQIGRNMNLLVKTGADPLAYQAAIRNEIRRVDPHQPVFAARSMNEVVSSSISDRRFVLILLGSFSVLALVLAYVG